MYLGLQPLGQAAPATPAAPVMTKIELAGGGLSVVLIGLRFMTKNDDVRTISTAVGASLLAAVGFSAISRWASGSAA
jgi:hypothetical protein